jgi:tetratricopeptide (TPR) repeat protein
MDDEIQVLQNVHIQSLSDLPSFFSSSSMGSGGAAKMSGIYYKPLMTTYYAIIWHFFGANPVPFRVPLLVIHIMSSYLIFLFSLNFLPRTYSLLLGLLFLVHPLNSEVVVYIADAQDIFYFFFGILSLYSIERINNHKILFGTLLLLFTAGLFSKETGALFLLISGVYVYLLKPKKIIPVFAAAAIIGCSYLLLRFQIGLTTTKSDALIFHSASFWERLQMLPLILGHYIELFFYPDRLSLSTDFILTEFSLQLFWLPLLLVIVFVAAIYKICQLLFITKYKKLTQFFLLVMFFWFILHGQIIIPLDGVYADRWFYLEVWGLSSLLIVFLYHRFASKNLIIFLSSIIVLFGIRSYVRSLDWNDPLNFYRRESSLHPWDAVMSNNVGVELFRHQKILEAEPFFAKATQINPRWPVAWNNLGAVREHEKDIDKALEMYLKSLNAAPYSLACENYAMLLYKRSEIEKVREFLKDKALPLFPNNPVLMEIWRRINL